MTPVLLIFFNRPEILKENLKSLSRIKPNIIFLACDGPRYHSNLDEIRVNECKQIAQRMINWQCQIEYLYAEQNFGCDIWVPKAISWFFDNVSEGIILEDDCIIDNAFYKFADCLLEKHRHNPKIMNISAANFQRKKWGNADYYYSGYPSNWGWATWSRAWKNYDDSLVRVDKYINSKKFDEFITNPAENKYWKKFYNQLKNRKCTYWDAKWLLSIWANDGVSITPNFNLVKNIGIGVNATHTKFDIQSKKLKINKEMTTEIQHCEFKSIECDADKFLFTSRYKPKIMMQLFSLLKKIIVSAKTL